MPDDGMKPVIPGVEFRHDPAVLAEESALVPRVGPQGRQGLLDGCSGKSRTEDVDCKADAVAHGDMERGAADSAVAPVFPGAVTSQR